VVAAEAAGEPFLDLEEVVEANHVEDAGQRGLASDHGEAAAGVLEVLVGTEKDGQTATVDVTGVSEIYDQRCFASAKFFVEMLFEQGGAGEVDVTACGDDSFFAGVKRSKTK